jgi:glutathione synthase/RimK-type ligase-like ATP-grasp enzyme
MPRTIGILHGMERGFPPALAAEINRRGEGRVIAEAVRLGAVRQDRIPRYDVILDRISHEVPFYRTWIKTAAAEGAQVVNNPFWWSADDKFLDNVLAQAAGVAVPKTVLLPHKTHPPNTSADTFTNLVFPIDWEAVFGYLGFPIFLKPAYGGGWRDVYRVSGPDEFFQAYDRTGSLCMMAQEAIDFTAYFRCYVLGRERVRVMPYDPKAPFERRYVRGAPPPPAPLLARLERDALALCRELGYDFNTVEFAVRDGVPYAIDFMNPAPDCDHFSVGPESFDWVLRNAAEMLIDRALRPRPLETAGEWPRRLGAARASAARERA